MNGQITLGGIFSRGFELFRKSYRKFLLIAVIMFAVDLTVGYLLQYLTMPVQMCGLLALEFSLIGAVASYGVPAYASEWSYSSGNWDGLYRPDAVSSATLHAPGAAFGWVIFFAVLLLVILFYAAYAILNSVVSGTFAVGAKQASVVLAEEGTPSFDGTFGFFGKRWRRCLGVTAWATLWTVLWGLLLVVPGIVKAYSYRFASYLVTQYPELTTRQALRKSMEITRGHKGKLFVLDFSLLAFGLCALIISCCFYLLPLIAASLLFISPLGYSLFAGAYVEIRREAEGKGLL